MVHSIGFLFDQGFTYLHSEIKDGDAKLDAHFKEVAAKSDAGFKEVAVKSDAGFKEVDAKLSKLGSDILSTLDGMQNARFVAAEIAHAAAGRQRPFTAPEFYDLEEDMSKRYALRSQHHRAEVSAPMSAPAPPDSSVSAQPALEK